MRDDELAKTATAVDTSPSSVGRVARTQLGRYRIEGELGAGGMGIVYAAFDPELERRVALKVLRPGLEGDGEQRLLREARAMARLSHPNVVSVFEVGTVDNCDYIAMELVDGGSLLEWLATKPPQRAILDAFIAAGTGLATAHEAGVVHRDFKPHNVLRSKAGRVVVTDFGLARETSGTPVSSRGSSLSGLTVPGSLLGTPAYMAPEQWEGGAISPATDQFSFCVALWEALAGERPFKGTTIEDTRESTLRGPERLDVSALPRRLRAPIVRGLALDPAKRWPSMPALLARLAPRRTLAIGLGAGAIAAIAIAFLHFIRRLQRRAVSHPRSRRTLSGASRNSC